MAECIVGARGHQFDMTSTVGESAATSADRDVEDEQIQTAEARGRSRSIVEEGRDGHRGRRDGTPGSSGSSSMARKRRRSPDAEACFAETKRGECGVSAETSQDKSSGDTEVRALRTELKDAADSPRGKTQRAGGCEEGKDNRGIAPQDGKQGSAAKEKKRALITGITGQDGSYVSRVSVEGHTSDV